MANESPRIEETYRVDRNRLAEMISKIDGVYPDTKSSRVILTKDGIEIYSKLSSIPQCSIGRLVSGAEINHLPYETYLQTYSGTDAVKPRLVDVFREFIV